MAYLDRDAARPILVGLMVGAPATFRVEATLDALEGCVRPIEGVVLTRAEAQYVRRLMWKQQSWDRDEQAFAERLEEAS